MKTLKESLFDNKLIEKDLFGDSEFKKWINHPDILWYIYYYWSSEMEDMLVDYHGEEWEKYKPTVDIILQLWNDDMQKVFGRGKNCFFWTNYDQYDFDNDVEDKFDSADELSQYIDNTVAEIRRKKVVEEDGVWKTWFKGGLPKGSAIEDIIQKFEHPMSKPGKLDGGIALTNEESILVLGFPKGINKEILKLFDIR